MQNSGNWNISMFFLNCSCGCYINKNYYIVVVVVFKPTIKLS